MKKLILLMLLISTSSFAFEGQIKQGYALLNPGSLQVIKVDNIDLSKEAIDLKGKKAAIVDLKNAVDASIGDVQYQVHKIQLVSEGNKVKVTGLFLLERITQKEVSLVWYANPTSARLRLDDQVIKFDINEKY